MKAKIESIGLESNFVGVDISKDTLDVCYLINTLDTDILLWCICKATATSVSTAHKQRKPNKLVENVRFLTVCIILLNLDRIGKIILILKN